MKKSVKELADEFGIGYQTLRIYLSRPEFDKFKLSKGYITINLDDKFKIYEVVKRLYSKRCNKYE